MKKIKITEVLRLLNNGLTRRGIANHFEISMKECQVLFRHEKLKGKKTKKKLPFEIIDDTINDYCDTDIVRVVKPLTDTPLKWKDSNETIYKEEYN